VLGLVSVVAVWKAVLELPAAVMSTPVLLMVELSMLVIAVMGMEKPWMVGQMLME
jgi:hypothetical protein